MWLTQVAPIASVYDGIQEPEPYEAGKLDLDSQAGKAAAGALGTQAAGKLGSKQAGTLGAAVPGVEVGNPGKPSGGSTTA